MVRVWYMDGKDTDLYLEHHKNPPHFISEEELRKKTGIECHKINLNSLKADGELNKIREDRGYTYEDVFEITKETLHKFKDEHLHADDESRLVLRGSGYFDARDVDDQWVRIEICPGDMLILPAGVYHRFSLNTNNPIYLRRFFSEEPVWKAYNRPADDLPARQQYLQRLQAGLCVPTY